MRTQNGGWTVCLNLNSTMKITQCFNKVLIGLIFFSDLYATILTQFGYLKLRTWIHHYTLKQFF